MDDCKTLTVPEAGKRYFDLGRNASYEAARRGDTAFLAASRASTLTAAPLMC